jgi:hypothetical protein
LTLLPDINVEAEADLWLGPLVQYRGPDGIVLRKDVAAWLQEQLASDTVRLKTAGELMLDAHRHLSPVLQLEERVAYLGLYPPNERADRALEEELGRVVRTLRDPKRRSMVVWVERVIDRLPPKVQNLEPTQFLRQVVAAYSETSERTIDPETLPETLKSWAIKKKSRLKFSFQLLLTGNMLQIAGDQAEGLTDSQAVPFKIPDTDPLFIEARWIIKGKEYVVRLFPKRDEVLRVPVGPNLTLRFYDGTGVAVRPTRQEPRATCFVIQGFGRKNDFQQSKIFDLDASYEVIKEAVTAAGLSCFRADELGSQGIIGQEIYEVLLHADVVIADLSTLNANALYELGVRFALRPYATIVVAEQGTNFPFDLNHIPIITYKHLGEDISRREARRFANRLMEAIKEKMADENRVDSPVYRFLPTLRPPFDTADDISTIPSFPKTENALTPEQSQPISLLIEQARGAMGRSDFETAMGLWQQIRAKGPKDDYVVQQLALATYKRKKPTEVEALKQAKDILEPLLPYESLDPETLRLWAALHKRLYEIEGDRQTLDEAIEAMERSFNLRNDYDSGINLAFLLNVRATLSEPADAVTDFVLANRIRRHILEIVKSELEAGPETENDRYSLLATLQEAAVGLGDDEAARRWRQQAREVAAAEWVIDATQMQTDQLKALMTPSPLRYLSAL